MYDYGVNAILEFMTGGVLIFSFAISIFFLVAYWKLFTKAGEPGWATLVPIYDLIVFLRIAKLSAWWFLLACALLFIPFINFIVPFIFNIFVMHGVSTNFGKDSGFTVGLVLLPIVFIPILAFGSAEYLQSGYIDGIESLGNL